MEWIGGAAYASVLALHVHADGVAACGASGRSE